jgi:hypothetical protein
VTFSAESDLTDRWLAVVTVGIQRDWTWNGEDSVALEISRTGAGVLAQIRLPRSVNPEVFQAPELAGAPVDRAATYLVFLDAIDPKPIPPAKPSEISLTYVVTPRFRIPPIQSDPALTLSADLPIAAAPTQTPKLVSAGVMLSPYSRTPDYSSSDVRTKMLWFEFAEPPTNPADGYFVRVLTYAPDPMLTRDAPVQLPPDPPLPISPEFIRVIRPHQPHDRRVRRHAADADDVTASLCAAAAALIEESSAVCTVLCVRNAAGTSSVGPMRGCGSGRRLSRGRSASRTAAQLRAFRTPTAVVASAVRDASLEGARSCILPATTMWISCTPRSRKRMARIIEHPALAQAGTDRKSTTSASRRCHRVATRSGVSPRSRWRSPRSACRSRVRLAYWPSKCCPS